MSNAASNIVETIICSLRSGDIDRATAMGAEFDVHWSLSASERAQIAAAARDAHRSLGVPLLTVEQVLGGPRTIREPRKANRDAHGRMLLGSVARVRSAQQHIAHCRAFHCRRCGM